MRVYNYVDAIRVFPTNFSETEKRDIMSKVNPRLYSKLRETFTVIDDDLDKVNSISRKSNSAGNEQALPSADSQSAPVQDPATGSNRVAVNGRNRGSKRQTDASSLLRQSQIALNSCVKFSQAVLLINFLSHDFAQFLSSS